MKKLVKLILVVFIIACIPFEMNAHICVYTPVTMSYAGNHTIGNHNTSHRSPAYNKSCPVEVSFDAENGVLVFDNTNGSNPMEYNICDEDGNIVLTGFFNAYSCNNVSLGNLPEGTYHLEVDVAGYAYSGIINI